VKSNNSDWITITSGNTFSGTGTVTYSVAGNTSTSQRTGTLTIAGQTFTVAQSAPPPPPVSPYAGLWNGSTTMYNIDVTWPVSVSNNGSFSAFFNDTGGYVVTGTISASGDLSATVTTHLGNGLCTNPQTPPTYQVTGNCSTTSYCLGTFYCSGIYIQYLRLIR
jgi:hypothetical protein